MVLLSSHKSYVKNTILLTLSDITAFEPVFREHIRSMTGYIIQLYDSTSTRSLYLPFCILLTIFRMHTLDPLTDLLRCVLLFIGCK